MRGFPAREPPAAGERTIVPQLQPEYVEQVRAALRAKRDIWTDEVLAAPEGPSYEAVLPYLNPLLLTDTTASGVCYLPLTYPAEGSVYALHVVDGSEILSEAAPTPYWAGNAQNRPERTKSMPLSYVFSAGEERIGTDLDRVGEQSLADGYLPILQTSYQAKDGARFQIESFVARPTGTVSTVSYIKVHAVPGDAPTTFVVTIATEAEGLHARGSTVVRDDRVYVAHDGSATWDGTRLIFDCIQERTILLAVWTRPAPWDADARTALDDSIYQAARSEVATYWRDLLAGGASFEVPEPLVMDAARNLLLQNLVLGHRYSTGNHYDMTFLMEGAEAIEPLLWFGFVKAYRDKLNELLWLTNGGGTDWYEHWEWGTKLVAAAGYTWFTGDDSLVRNHLDRLVGYLRTMKEQRAKDPEGLLPPERWAWDIPDPIYGLHSLSWAWRGIRDMATVLSDLGYEELGDEYAQEASELGAALLARVERVEARMDDGTLFIPIDLTPGKESAYEAVTESRLGSYWNLAFSWVLTSDLLGHDRREQILDYMERHGSWLLRMIRFNGVNVEPVPIGGGVADGPGGYKSSGVDNAWGVQATKALADSGRADDLVVAFYARLAHGMTRGTFIAGEGETVDPCQTEYFRSAAGPPNSTNNALFLDILRLMVAREVFDERGAPRDLELASATPRHWLEGGKRIAVQGVPTAFGDLTFEMRSTLAADGTGTIDVVLSVPSRRSPARVRIGVRVPRGSRVVSVAGSTDARLDGETIELVGPAGEVRLSVTCEPVGG
jgi:hypothetical protein